MQVSYWTGALIALLAVQGCAGPTAQGAGQPGPRPAQAAEQGVAVPTKLQRALLPKETVASGLKNPRGIHPLPGGGLLVSEAGTGEPDSLNSGALTALTDRNGDGDYDDEGERKALLSGQPSKNILHVVRRDEVFGMAAISAGAGDVLTALAFFGGPSTIFKVDGETVSEWGATHGNVNDLTYDAARKAWFAVASTTDEIIRLQPGGLSERVVKFPTLASGQDAVPGYLNVDPQSGHLLVSLFTGSPEGEEGGDGTELVPRAGAIAEVDADTKAIRYRVTGLTVPTDFGVAADGTLYVLEFCDAFLDPVNSRQDMAGAAMHGGFKRYSGRLLRIDPAGETRIVAEGLDAPTNLVLTEDAIFIAEGMGTPGRLIPSPEGPRPLDGRITRIAL